jgi:prefoldin subunit 5
MASATDYLEKALYDLKEFKTELTRKIEEIEKRLKALESKN